MTKVSGTWIEQTAADGLRLRVPLRVPLGFIGFRGSGV